MVLQFKILLLEFQILVELITNIVLVLSLCFIGIYIMYLQFIVHIIQITVHNIVQHLGNGFTGPKLRRPPAPRACSEEFKVPFNAFCTDTMGIPKHPLPCSRFAKGMKLKMPRLESFFKLACCEKSITGRPISETGLWNNFLCS